MKKLLILALFSLTFTHTIPAFAGTKEIQRAESYRKGGKHSLAVKILEDELIKTPTSFAAHKSLGLTYLETGNLGGATEHLERAAILNPKFEKELGRIYFETGLTLLQRGGEADSHFRKALYYEKGFLQQIGTAYAAAGLNFLSQGQPDVAKNLFGKALQIEPSMIDIIGEECLKKGAEYLKYRQYDTAEKIFEVATKYNDNLKIRVSEIFYDIGKECNTDEQIRMLQKSLKYSLAIKDKVVKALENKFKKGVALMEFNEGEQKIFTKLSKGQKWAYLFIQSFPIETRPVQPNGSVDDWYTVVSLNEYSAKNQSIAPFDFSFEIKTGEKNLIIMFFP